MVAVGKGGKILSRDCDLIIADDIEDHGTTIQPSAREQTRQWWTTTLSSRKEEHTGVVVIGSRQHPEDLYNFLLENPEFEHIVEEAHKTDCVLPETETDKHKDCMLWKNKRTYKWLMSQKNNADTTGGRAIYEMVYLNKAFVEGITMFNSEDIDQCRDVNRVVGQVPAGTYLVAGLDPASTGFQACFLWAVNPDSGMMYLVDIENEEGGGVAQAKKSIKKWYEKYSLAHWVIEENGFQKAIRQDRDIKEYSARMGIHLEGPFINANKLGAQPNLAQKPSIDFIKKLTKIDLIKLITIAPEIEGMEEFINFLTASNIKIQFGHSLADYQCCAKYMNKNEIGFTHLYNAMSGNNHRQPGVLSAALEKGKYAEIICDNIHVSEQSIKIAKKCISGLYAITDAINASGLKDGEYIFAKNDIIKENNSVKIKKDNTLAGSIITMDQTFKNLIQMNFSIEEAVQMTSYNASRYLKLSNIGLLNSGYKSNFLVLDKEYNILDVYLEGNKINE